MPVLEDRIMSPTEARQDFFRVLHDVRSGTPVTIHQAREEDVTLVPRAFLLALLHEMERLALHIESLELSISPDTLEAIQRSEEDIKAGRTVGLAEARKRFEEKRRGRGKR